MGMWGERKRDGSAAARLPSIVFFGTRRGCLGASTAGRAQEAFSSRGSASGNQGKSQDPGVPVDGRLGVPDFRGGKEHHRVDPACCRARSFQGSDGHPSIEPRPAAAYPRCRKRLERQEFTIYLKICVRNPDTGVQSLDRFPNV